MMMIEKKSDPLARLKSKRRGLQFCSGKCCHVEKDFKFASCTRMQPLVCLRLKHAHFSHVNDSISAQPIRWYTIMITSRHINTLRTLVKVYLFETIGWCNNAFCYYTGLEFMEYATALRAFTRRLFHLRKPNYPGIVLKHHKFCIIFDKF